MSSHMNEVNRKAPAPAALVLGESVARVTVQGEFDCESSTWSNREYQCASAKKHNEGM